MRKLFVTVVFALLVAACGGDAESTSSPTAAPQPEPVESAPSGSVDGTSAESSEAPSDTAPPTGSGEANEPSFDGPPAPDFELTLNDGSTFQLSGEQKPVYIVFWAEW